LKCIGESAGLQILAFRPQSAEIDLHRNCRRFAFRGNVLGPLSLLAFSAPEFSNRLSGLVLPLLCGNYSDISRFLPHLPVISRFSNLMSRSGSSDAYASDIVHAIGDSSTRFAALAAAILNAGFYRQPPSSELVNRPPGRRLKKLRIGTHYLKVGALARWRVPIYGFAVSN
jgi:hypothetical protein